MTSTFVSIIESLDVELALSSWGSLPIEEIEKQILRHAYDKNDIRAYTLATQLLLHQNRWEWHYLASMILSQALCHIPGAYFSAFYHAVEASKLAPDDKSLKEYLLFFYILPDRPMSDERASEIANQLLLSDPDNRAAIETIAKFEKRKSPKTNSGSK